MIQEKQHGKRCILTVDDDRVLLARLNAGMGRAGYEVLQATTAQEAIELLAQRVPDLALLDISMPGMSGMELARYLRRETSVPFMFLSSHVQDDIVRQAAEHGAIGYLVKPIDTTQLIPALEAALMRAQEISHLRLIGADLAAALATGRKVSESMRRQLELLVESHSSELARLNQQLDLAQKHVLESEAHARELARMANEDPLTTLPNRHWLTNYLPAALRRVQASGRMLAVMYLDLDGFKAVNDTLGHLAGDELLRAAALRMKSALKPSDSIARHGGDEFVLIIEQMNSESDAAQVAQRMLEVLRNPFELTNGRNIVAASIGVSLYPRDGADSEQLLARADEAMYRAKTSGRGLFRFYAHPSEDPTGWQRVATAASRPYPGS
ncbi:diguanylate cyclase [Lacisediminimonas sp.]|uniref:diguanylate cyclase n=1 Tax=Lacisediminimonas sp. TaxID=3060582 RepID=UPI0027271C0A|nr:diguanylate cyclase [Lacisediminimonas sp.]MDO8300660.1 diguanylate cyclase [Lacisediminimonas sp.]MDO9218297.1 diguanylate cyclase [Lacisediminimonas sp.]